MDILAVEGLSTFILSGNVIILGTILLCYGLAVGLGHVPAWLPMISDCAVEAPEKYPFRMGIVVGAFLLGFEVVAVYNSDRKFSKDKTCLYLGCIASFGLAVVGVVNEKENNTIHSSGAVVFFFLYDAYMVIMAWNVTLDPDSPKWSVVLKQTCAVLCTIALGVFVILATDWGKNQIYIAVCEWFGTIAILVFQVSFAADLNYIACIEVSYKEAMNKSYEESDEESEESFEPITEQCSDEVPLP